MTLTAQPQADCASCGKSFLRFSTTQRACNYRCAIKLVKADKKAEKEDTRARRLAIKSRADWLNEAQVEVNRYVRLRDQGRPCISCNAPWTPNFQAGHYLSRGARPELRFDLANIHGQCVRCNMHLSGNLLNYRIGLTAKSGLPVVEKLEGHHPPMHYSVDELRIIKHTHRALARELQKEIA